MKVVPLFWSFSSPWLGSAAQIDSESAVVMQTKDATVTMDYGALRTQLDGAEQLVKVIAEKPGWGADDRKIMQDMLDIVIKEMTDVLDSEHNDDQKEFNGKKTKHQKCLDDHQNVKSGTTGELTKLHTKALESKQKHKKCLKLQFSWDAYKTAGAACVKDMSGLALGSVEQQHDTLTTRLNTVKTDNAAYNSATPVGKAAACTVDQMRYEGDICTLRVATKRSCDEVNQCITNVDLDGLKKNLATKQTNRQNLLHSINKLKCRIKYLLEKPFTGDTSKKFASKFDTSKDPDPCGNLNVDRTKYVLSMVIPQWKQATSGHQKCAPNLPEPSTSDSTKCSTWRTAEYTWTDHANVAACMHTCDYSPLATTTTTTTATTTTATTTTATTTSTTSTTTAVSTKPKMIKPASQIDCSAYYGPFPEGTIARAGEWNGQPKIHSPGSPAYALHPNLQVHGWMANGRTDGCQMQGYVGFHGRIQKGSAPATSWWGFDFGRPYQLAKVKSGPDAMAGMWALYKYCCPDYQIYTSSSDDFSLPADLDTLDFSNDKLELAADYKVNCGLGDANRKVDNIGKAVRFLIYRCVTQGGNQGRGGSMQPVWE